MSSLVQPGFAMRLAVHLVAVATVVALALLVSYEAWTPLVIVVLMLSACAAWITVRWNDFDRHFDKSPGLGAAVLICSVVLGFPLVFLYERVPFVPKSSWMKCRAAGRRVMRGVRGAVDFQLQERVVNGREVAPSLYLILRHTTQAEALRRQRDIYIDAYRSRLTAASVPDLDVSDLYVGFVSREEITEGGGGFHFWRDGPRAS